MTLSEKIDRARERLATEYGNDNSDPALHWVDPFRKSRTFSAGFDAGLKIGILLGEIEAAKYVLSRGVYLSVAEHEAALAKARASALMKAARHAKNYWGESIAATLRKMARAEAGGVKNE